jgi:hypothetical protein
MTTGCSECSLAINARHRCLPGLPGPGHARPGLAAAASEQCNGVRENAPNIAQVRGQPFVEYQYS